MDDRAFVEAFESCTLGPQEFRHRDHVRLAWIYLRAETPARALARFADGLKRFAAALGKAGLYHETITWAYLLLIRERMERQGEGANASFEAFAAANPDLMTWKPSVLAAYYRDDTLASPLARRTFVMPDRLGAEAG